MAITQVIGFGEGKDEIEIRKIGLGDLRAALAQGWGDFLAKRGDIVFAGIVYIAMMLLAGFYAQNESDRSASLSIDCRIDSPWSCICIRFL